MFIGNSTSWITNIQGVKYKIQVNSNRHISYLMYKYHKHQPCLLNKMHGMSEEGDEILDELGP